MNKYLVYGIEQGASDLHFIENEVPRIVVQGKMSEFGERIDSEQISKFFKDFQITISSIESKDFAISLNGHRMRCNAYYTLSGRAIAIRILPSEVPTFENLRTVDAIKQLADIERGLILVTGITGSGKSTTIAAILNHINKTRYKHIITVEQPIEYKFLSDRCLFSQREIGAHVDNYAQATRDAMRQNPDIVYIGEMRDLETIQEGIRIAETGHLVLSTVHANSAVGTIDRMVDFFPSEIQQQIRVELTNVIEGIVNQALITTLDNKQALIAEVLRPVPAIRSALSKGMKPESIRDQLRINSDKGCLHKADCARNILKEYNIDKDALRMLIGETDYTLATRK